MSILDVGSTTDPVTVPAPARLQRRFVGITGLIGVLLVIAAGSGLFLDPYAGETDFARNGYRGADLVTLAAIVPLLAWATVAAVRGSGRALLLWLGAVAYVSYQYGYTFAYGWNRLFLVYLALLALSAFTMAAALISLDPRSLAGRFDRSTPTRAVGGFLWFIGISLGLMELGQIVPTVFTGDVPQIVTDTGHPTSPVYVLDLGLVVPLLLLGGAWLRQRRPWGYFAAAILLVKGATVGLGLLAANLFAIVGGDKNDGPLILLWAAIALGSTAVLWRFLGHLEDDHRRAPRPGPATPVEVA